MPLDPFQREALTALYWHRLVATDQIARLIAPGTPARTVRHKLLALRRSGLADRVTREHRPLTWFVTTTGASTVEAARRVDPRPYRIPGPAVVNLLQDHALDVVETGLAFVETARERGHDCGALSWTPEVAHHFQERKSRSRVIADAVLHYVAEEAGQRSQRTFFIELDRATMPVARLAQKLRAYVRYHDYIPTHPTSSGRPAWRQHYARFPQVLIVLSGAAEHVLDRRLVDLRAHARAMAESTRIPALATTLPRLRRDGLLAEIAVPLHESDGELVSVLSRARPS
ncbi:replication-relaxation family protein [Amycolatopsis sp. NPDC059657]|uniref:replication-relaxation family protein n=1 Tax=Amycolatopsis sp. NPDC059657 TaxID=3346899 RepID=UPI00366E9F84